MRRKYIFRNSSAIKKGYRQPSKNSPFGVFFLAILYEV